MPKTSPSRSPSLPGVPRAALAHPSRAPGEALERGRVRALGRCGALGLWALSACTVHRGEWAAVEPAAVTAIETRESGVRPALRLLLIGDAGDGGRSGGAVAAALEERLQAGRAAGVPTILLWLGDNFAPARCDGGIDPRIAPLAEVAATHVRAGGASHAAVGPGEWACAGELAGGLAKPGPAGAPQGPQTPIAAPWSAPALNYVLRVGQDGQARQVSRCAGEPVACALEAPPAPALDGSGAPPLLELVILDSAAWLAPPAESSPLWAAAERSLAEQAALLAALRAAPGTPRILVSHHPIESAGPHGQGGRWPDSAFYLHAEPVRAAIGEGMFVGVVAGHEHGVQASGDLTPAIKRSSRVWIDAPVFEVVSGGATRSDAWTGTRSWRYFQGLSLAPEAISNHAGFAEVTVRGGEYELALWARRGGRWRRAEVTVPRQRPAHPTETKSPGMEFCLQCDTTMPRE